jgi:Amt family ammonium transporter
MLKSNLGYDDALDAFGVHGIGGILGGLLLGVCASTAWNAGGADGLIFGESALFIANLQATVVGCLYAAGVSFLLIKGLDATLGLRVDEDVEVEGLDVHLHGERAYSDGRGKQLDES